MYEEKGHVWSIYDTNLRAAALLYRLQNRNLLLQELVTSPECGGRWLARYGGGSSIRLTSDFIAIATKILSDIPIRTEELCGSQCLLRHGRFMR